MTVQRGRPFLQIPGPTNIPDRVLSAMHRQAIDVMGPEFIEFSRRLIKDLDPLFRNENGQTFVFAANGHGAWEAALANTLSPGDTVLVPQTGNFSIAWAAMAKALHLEPAFIENDWRHAIDPQKVEDVLRADAAGEIKAVLAVQIDTATSILSDIAAIRQAIDAAAHPALFMVDTIASLGIVDFRQDDWQVDVAVGGAQKGLMMAPGVSFTSVSPKALEAHQSSTMPRRYWDWTARQDSVAYMWFCGTAPEQLLFGLRESINMVMEEGLAGAHRRHRRLADGVRAAIQVWAQAGALEFNAVVPEERANSVTTIRVPEGVDGEDVRIYCREKLQVSLGTGLGQLSGKAFRIGHMGDLNEPMVLGTLGCVEAALIALGIPHGSGGVSAAAERFAEDD